MIFHKKEKDKYDLLFEELKIKFKKDISKSSKKKLKLYFKDSMKANDCVNYLFVDLKWCSFSESNGILTLIRD